MTIRFDHLLRAWYPRRDEVEWVLATIIGTEHSTYRKTGAMMLINSLGQHLGMLSGGCLEGDLLAQAHKVMMRKTVLTATYDLREDSDSPWQQGLGCGGAMNVLLQPMSVENSYLGLESLHRGLESGQTMRYLQRLDTHGTTQECWEIEHIAEGPSFSHPGSQKIDYKSGRWLASLISPAPQLLIVGGGMDAQPLCALARTIGWYVSVADPRVGYARAEDFPGAHIHKQDLQALNHKNYDAIVIMSHSLSIDASGLYFAGRSNARYVGILGPEHRRRRVEKLAEIQPEEFRGHYCGPAGLDIGAKLPETIALSILAQCHQVIEGNASPQLTLMADARETSE